ncbi:hypothetical protein ABZ532_11720 [Streptomyces sp. NPDC019396]|uniref:hypothetical protein n=1 Tax=Streptomyces sp. NPDC019396 TaxID=3154687 RepID=UPI0033C197CD
MWAKNPDEAELRCSTAGQPRKVPATGALLKAVTGALAEEDDQGRVEDRGQEGHRRPEAAQRLTGTGGLLKDPQFRVRHATQQTITETAPLFELCLDAPVFPRFHS